MAFHTSAWDLGLFRWINEDWRNPVFDVLMPLVSSSIFLWMLAVILVGVGLRQGRFLPAIVLGLILGIGASDLTCSVFKDGVGRVRPYQCVAGTWYLEDGIWAVRPDDFTPTKHRGSSLPSAHAANAAAASLILFCAYRKKAIWILPVAVGYSRIYLGKHFPLDVLTGWLVGLEVAWLVTLIYPALWSRVFSRWMR